MAGRRGLGAIFLGVVIGYFIWGNEPAYIDNIKENESISFVLQSIGFLVKDRYQVAVIHGFFGNEEICNTLAERYEREDGIVYHCMPSVGILGGKPWWNFW